MGDYCLSQRHFYLVSRLDPTVLENDRTRFMDIFQRESGVYGVLHYFISHWFIRVSEPAASPKPPLLLRFWRRLQSYSAPMLHLLGERMLLDLISYMSHARLGPLIMLSVLETELCINSASESVPPPSIPDSTITTQGQL